MIKQTSINDISPLTEAERLSKDNCLLAELETCQRIERELLHNLGQAKTLSEYNSLNAQRVQAISNTEKAYLKLARR